MIIYIDQYGQLTTEDKSFAVLELDGSYCYDSYFKGYYHGIKPNQKIPTMKEYFHEDLLVKI